MAKKKIVEKIDGFKNKSSAVITSGEGYSNIQGSTGIPTQGGEPCPVYPFDVQSINTMTCEQLQVALGDMLKLKAQAYRNPDTTCKQEWDEINAMLVNAKKNCTSQSGGGTGTKPPPVKIPPRTVAPTPTPTPTPAPSPTPSVPTTTITTTGTPVILGGGFGGGLGQELTDKEEKPVKKGGNWLIWVLIAGAVYLFTRKK